MDIKSKHQSLYYFNGSKKALIVEGIETNEERFSKNRRMDFYGQNFLLKSDGCKNLSKRLSAEDVEHSFINCEDIMFEVTTSCNINCEYCVYGDLYCTNKPEHLNLTVEMACSLLDYIVNLKKAKSSSVKEQLKIHFYGGEPLLNMSFIESIVEYCKSLSENINFEFGITTNALLLDKFILFFVNNDFEVLISLDGDCESNSYRLNKRGNFTFNQVFTNSISLKDKYPTFFQKNVNFNAVLHNRNSLEQIYQFFETNFGKKPLIAAISNTGVNPLKIQEFKEKYNNVSKSYAEIRNPSIKKGLINYEGAYDMAYDFIESYSPNIYNNALELITNRNSVNRYPTGTCMPFSRSIFLTAQGEILPCTQVSPEFALGKVSHSNQISISFERIASVYNTYFDNVIRQCKVCYNSEYCNRCVLEIPMIKTSPVCPDYKSQAEFEVQVEQILSYLETNPLSQSNILHQIADE